MMRSLEVYAQNKLDSIERRHLHRSLNETVREDGLWIERGGRRLLSFACNDYLNLTQHPDAQSPIVPVIIGGEDETMAASRLLAEEGFLSPAIRPPTVPDGTSRLRLTFTAVHPDAEVERLAALVRSRVMAR